MAYNRKFKYYYTTNFAKEKGVCKPIRTIEKDKNGSFTRIYDDLKECHFAYFDYKQASTGINHNEREIIVVDVDNNVGDPAIWAKINLPIMPSRASKNTKNGHCQFYYYLDKPVRKESADWKKLLEYSRQFGDRNYTGWQMRNPFYKDKQYKIYVWNDDKFNISDFEPYIKSNSTKSETFSSSLLCTNVTNKNNIISETGKSNAGKVKFHQGRNCGTFYKLGSFMTLNVENNYTEKELFLKWKEFNKQVSDELGLPESPESEGWATVKSLMNYKKNNSLNFWTDDERAKSTEIRKNKANERRMNIVYCMKELKLSVKEICKRLKISRQTYYRDLEIINSMNSNTTKSGTFSYFLLCTNVTLLQNNTYYKEQLYLPKAA